MIVQSKEIKLKNGNTCILRSPKEADAEAMLLHDKKTAQAADDKGYARGCRLLAIVCLCGGKTHSNDWVKWCVKTYQDAP